MSNSVGRNDNFLANFLENYQLSQPPNFLENYQLSQPPNLVGRNDNFLAKA